LDIKDIGIYSLLSKKHNDFTFQGGVRWDMRQFNIPTSITIDSTFNDNFQGLNYAFGVRYQHKQNDFRFNISSGQRSPNASELVSNGVHHGSLRYELGDRTLESEKAHQMDLSYMFKGEHFQLLLNPFYCLITDFKYLQNQDSIVDGFNLFKYQAANTANIYGGEVVFHYHPHFAHDLHLELSYAHTRATFDEIYNLPLIPQNSTNTIIRYQLIENNNKNNLSIHLQHQYFFTQTNFGLNETSTSDYQLVNFTLKYDRKGQFPFSLQTGVRNLLNEKYIPHTSVLKNLGLSDPGRNIYVSLILEINKNK
jgi:iron complex outermembrane receptor protein